MPTLIDYKKELNQAQYEAVASIEGPHLVIAGAGSGKTRVLVYRTAYLVEQGVDPRSILLLTFTRRAASQMLERASHILDERCQNVSGGTFHSFANLTLRRFADRIGLSRGFSILDEQDAESLVGILRKKRGFDKLDKRFPKKATLYSVISKSINKCMDVEEVFYDEYPQLCQWAEQAAVLKNDYALAKRDMGVLDYDDLLIFLRDLLQQHQDIRRSLSRQYRYIMVDEYQDTNHIQAQIIRLLTDDHANIMVVGDDSQSIYAFRGAQFRNIIDFPNAFPGAKVVMLEENYRSSQPILDLTNEVIQSSREKFDKVLFSRRPGKQRPKYVDVYHENSQSKYITRRIAELRQEGVPLGEIAVLFRSGWHSNDLEIELSSWRIPFVKYGGQKFTEASHVKDVLAYLNIIHNRTHELAWLRVLMMVRGIGPKSAANLTQRVVSSAQLPMDAPSVVKNADLRRLFESLAKIDAAAQKPAEILDAVLNMYHPFFMDQYDDYDKRINDLESLQRIIQRYSSLEAFLSDLTLEPMEKSVLEAQRTQKKGDVLTLSTIHSAKGLEWHTVFLIHVCEGFLPSYKALNSHDAIEEERRLFYVATTRAKENLYLLRPQRNSSVQMNADVFSSPYTRVSRFIGEGRILTDYVDIEQTSFAPAATRAWTDDYFDATF
ncbi:MAG TPA: ATP-dependent helicase [Candidatus Omnitrophota bacterium]|nr:ATP-dependent helicase [Candidatus Omnitrophota bacterium]HSA31275.1 ATP-dependent helicase [Candidatus Omnitrophota bacterium]